MINLNLGKKLGFAALLAFSATSANALVLDTFDYELDILVNGTDSSTVQATSIQTTILGFDALYGLTYTAGAGDFSSTASADTVNVIGTSDGELAYASAGQQSSVLQITWTDLDANSGDWLDLVDGENTGIYLDLEAVDLSFNLDMTVSWFDGSSVIDTAFNTNVSESINAPTRVFYDFSNWTGANFTQVAAFTAVISGVPDADFRISEVGASTVPEPTTLAIFGLGLMGFAVSRKRKA